MSEAPMNNDMVIGEMRGQLRELVHSVNNLSGKFDGLTREVAGLGPLGADIAEIRSRLAKLEEVGSRQTGAYAVISAILQSPAIYWAVMVAGLIWAAATGRIKP